MTYQTGDVLYDRAYGTKVVVVNTKRENVDGEMVTFYQVEYVEKQWRNDFELHR